MAGASPAKKPTKRKPNPNRKPRAAKAAQAKPPLPIEPMAVPTFGDDKITSAEQWGATSSGEGHVIELPTGHYAKVRRTLNLPTMLSSGRIPNPLAGLIEEMMDKGLDQPNIPDEDRTTQMQLFRFINEMVCELFIQPRVEMRPKGWDDERHGPWKPSAGAIRVDQVDVTDQMYVFAWAQGAALDVARFREQSTSAMAAAQHVATVADAARLAAGDK